MCMCVCGCLCMYANYDINISICTLIYHSDDVPPTSVANLCNWLSAVIFELSLLNSMWPYHLTNDFVGITTQLIAKA